MNSTHDVTIKVNPPEVYAGLTSHLTLNCSFCRVDDSDFSNVISLILSKTDKLDDKVLNELAAITQASPNNVTVTNSLTAVKVSGVLANGKGFISYEWEDPGDDALGSYRCEAFGVDSVGHPRVSSAEAEVNSQPINVDASHIG